MQKGKEKRRPLPGCPGEGVVYLTLLFCRHFLIHPHEPGHAGGLVGFLDRHAIGLHDGLVVGLVSFAQLRRHCERVVQVRQAAVGIECAGIEDSLGGLLDPGMLVIGGRGPGKSVVDNISRIPIITF